MEQRQFTNMVRSLFNIDGYLLPELTSGQQIEFVRDPVRYFINGDKVQSTAIFREIAKRQPAPMTYSGIAVDELARSGVLGWHPGDEA